MSLAYGLVYSIYLYINLIKCVISQSKEQIYNCNEQIFSLNSIKHIIGIICLYFIEYFVLSIFKVKVNYVRVTYYAKPVFVILMLILIITLIIGKIIITILIKQQKSIEQTERNSYISINDYKIKDQCDSLLSHIIQEKAMHTASNKVLHVKDSFGRFTEDYKLAVENEINFIKNEYTLTKEEFADFINEVKDKYYINDNYQIQGVYIKSYVVDYCNYVKNIRNKRYKVEIQKIEDDIIDNGISVNQFIELRKNQNEDITGVYILHNLDKHLYYVGQAKKLYDRVNNHFTGHGNPDVYFDYRSGDTFSIQLIYLSNSGYDSLDKLEEDMIKKYNAYDNGYNRTRGNSSNIK